MVTSTCEQCRQRFTVQYNGQRYCGPLCRKNAKRQRREKGIVGVIKPVAVDSASSLNCGDRGDQKLIERAVKNWPEQALPVLPVDIVEHFAAQATNPLLKSRVAQGAAKVAISAFKAIHGVHLDHKKFERGDGSAVAAPIIDREAVKKWLDDDEANTSQTSTDGVGGKVEDSPPPGANLPEVNEHLPREIPTSDR